MRKCLVLAIAGSLSLWIAQCSQIPTESRTSSDDKSVKIAITTPAHFDTIAAWAYVRVSGHDMVTIKEPLSILDSAITGVVNQIPSGYNRKFEVLVYGYDSTLKYCGSAFADIFANDTVCVSIILKKPGGSAIISGYIEEIADTSDSLSQPGIPYILNYYSTYSIPPQTVITFTITDGDTLYLPGYLWTVSYSVNGKENSYQEKSSAIFTDTFVQNGFYKVYVQAYSYDSINNLSPYSNPFYFEIRNGMLVDTLIPSFDTVPPIIKFNGPDSLIIAIGDTFNDPGVSAYDNIDGDITHKVTTSGNINTFVPGVYTIVYTVLDRAGNCSKAQRLVFVRELTEDFTPPVITLFGSPTLYLNPGDTFFEPGYSAYDNVDGDITYKVVVDICEPSLVDDSGNTETRVVYRVSDAAYNQSEAVRMIIRSNSERIEQPSQPWIISQTNNNPPVVDFVFGTDTITTSKGGTVDYIWTITSPYDSAFTKVTTGSILKFKAMHEGPYALTVAARSIYHPDIISPKSRPLWFSAKDSSASAMDSIHY